MSCYLVLIFMAEIIIPKENKKIVGKEIISKYLIDRGIWYDAWKTEKEVKTSDSQQEILDAFESSLSPFMEKNGYKTADVININENIENLEAIRLKFLKEHTHNEDEVRFFIDGVGYFWFNIDDGNIFCVKCEKGDLLSVPAGIKHWFDLGPKPFVKAIRIFIDESGWVPHYTNSGIDAKFIEY